MSGQSGPFVGTRLAQPEQPLRDAAATGPAGARTPGRLRSRVDRDEPLERPSEQLAGLIVGHDQPIGGKLPFLTEGRVRPPATRAYPEELPESPVDAAAVSQATATGTATVTVQAEPTATPTPTGDVDDRDVQPLAFTGNSTAPLLIVAVALIIAGTLAVRTSRRGQAS